MSTRIKDIAEKAKVSLATVSLVLNNKPGVKGTTRERVIDIARELRYDFNQSKTSLTPVKGRIRFLKIAKHGHTVNRDHDVFIADYIEGLNQEAQSSRYQFEISTHDTKNIRSVIDSHSGSSPPDGLIVLGTELSYEDIKAFEAIRIPVGFIDSYYDFIDFDFVDMNNIDASYRILNHFISNGHREIGFINSPVQVKNFKLRLIGYREALKNFNLPFNEKYVFTVDSTFNGAYSDMLSLINRGVELPSALYIANDIMAYGCIKALKERGYSIPGDISIIGFDDLPMSSMMDPPLSTVKVSKIRIGKMGMKLLIMRLEENPDIPPEKILISGELICRKSVKKL